jgi:TetR/AcrR family transcriptional regulator, cholesterol catabolism regulator
MPKKTEPAQSGIARRRSAAREEGNEEYRAKRAALVQAAAAVFQEKGYEAATLNDIAERLGTDRASLYYYVGSKKELFQEAVAGTLDANVLKAEAILASDEPARDRLRALVTVLIESYEASYPATYVYIQEDMRRIASDTTAWAKQMRKQTRRVEAITTELIEVGIAEGALRDDVATRLATNALFGMVNWTHRWFKPGRGLSAAEVAAAFSDIFLDGMSAGPAAKAKPKPRPRAKKA